METLMNILFYGVVAWCVYYCYTLVKVAIYNHKVRREEHNREFNYDLFDDLNNSKFGGMT